MRKIIPLLFAIFGLLVGGGIGKVLYHPATSDLPADAEADDAHASSAAPPTEDPENPPEYVKMSNQFIIPVLEDGHVSAMVILTLSLEVKSGSSEAIYAREPKLRDAFLQVLFDHANTGGFKGSFTDSPNLTVLRRALKEVAQLTIGDLIIDVLVTDLARQDS